MHAHTPGEESARRHARATRQWQRSCLSRRCAPSAAAHVLLPRCMLVRIRTTAVSTPALHPTTGTPRAVRLFSAASLPTLLPTPLPGSAAHARRKGQRILPPTPCLAAPHARPAWPRPAEGAHRQLDPPQGLSCAHVACAHGSCLARTRPSARLASITTLSLSLSHRRRSGGRQGRDRPKRTGEEERERPKSHQRLRAHRAGACDGGHLLLVQGARRLPRNPTLRVCAWGVGIVDGICMVLQRTRCLGLCSYLTLTLAPRHKTRHGHGHRHGYKQTSGGDGIQVLLINRKHPLPITPPVAGLRPSLLLPVPVSVAVTLSGSRRSRSAIPVAICAVAVAISLCLRLPHRPVPRCKMCQPVWVCVRASE